MRPNLLYITSHLPSYQFPEAGQKSARMILDGYSKDYDITMVCFYNSAEERMIQKEDFSFCHEVFYFKVTTLNRILNVLFHPLLPLSTAYRASYSAAWLVKLLIKSGKFDIIHSEFTACGYYLKFAGEKIKKVISEHDVTYQSLERKKAMSRGIKKWLFTIEYYRQRVWEKKILKKADEIIVHNTKDQSLLIADGIPAVRIRVIRPYVNPVFKGARRDKVEPGTILFWGAMNRKENTDAVLYFVDKILPVVQKSVPKVKLLVVGANPPHEIVNLESPHIVVTGFVEDPLSFFEKSVVAVAPLRLGAGIKVKVLECLEAGIPVVATSVGAEGISDDKLYEINDPFLFGQKIIEFISIK